MLPPAEGPSIANVTGTSCCRKKKNVAYLACFYVAQAGFAAPEPQCRRDSHSVVRAARGGPEEAATRTDKRKLGALVDGCVHLRVHHCRHICLLRLVQRLRHEVLIHGLAASLFPHALLLLSRRGDSGQAPAAKTSHNCYTSQLNAADRFGAERTGAGTRQRKQQHA